MPARSLRPPVHAALLASALALGHAPPARAGDIPPRLSTTPVLAAEKSTLANGLEVILDEDHRTPIVTVNLWYHVGSKDEAERRNGFAHLFEHVMFQGSKHVPEDTYFRFREQAGASSMVVVVGEKTTVAQQLETLGLGPIDERDPYGNPLGGAAPAKPPAKKK